MKTAHIISHSHWDREWYLPYESHHMRLIMLIDQILDAIDNDSDFKSFHLDGQTICIDDYLQVKPQNREKLLNAIKSGKINIGPWYILQDAFLTSAEANVRNGYYGDIDCQRYGAKTKVGYYPDTFGIYSQAPQILSELEINNMIFGRGVSTTGFNNEVSNDFESKYSEMKVVSSNGSAVLGILFANWYSNGNEIPTDKSLAKEYWEKKISECERYTECQNLLFMNGCDHTPYQADVTAAIKVANELYPDICFKQSTFEEYLNAVNKEIDESSLSTISGELTSQTTDGLYTLVNTASSRIRQKVQNAETQDKYQYLVEPLSALYSSKYLHSELEYGWKKLMQNHPHDSICGCSVDSVHNTIDSRFEDSNNIADHIVERTLEEIATSICSENMLEFTLVNPSEMSNTNHKVIIEYAREEFGTDFRSARDKMKNIIVPALTLFDDNGNEVDSTISDRGIKFDYYLPDDKFRRPYYSRNIEVEFSYKFDFIGHTTFHLKESNDVKSKLSDPLNQLENEVLDVVINEDCTLTITDKESGEKQTGMMQVYDQGDIGNEYMFGSVYGDQPIVLNKFSSITNNSTSCISKRSINAKLSLPESADSQLEEEQLEIVEYNVRESKRSEKFVDLPIVIELELGKYDKGLKIDIKFTNSVKDHRMRVRFHLDNMKPYHLADSAFETVKRDNLPLATWKNKNFDNRLAKFVKLLNDKAELIIATNGLHEYEVKDNYVDISIIRCVGELGDWGHFPTPEAQCLYENTASLYLMFSKRGKNYENIARSIFVKQPFVQLRNYEVSKFKRHQEMLDLTHDEYSYISTIKKSLDNELIIRLGSNGFDSKFVTNYGVLKTNMLERTEEKLANNIVAANEIVTLKVEKK